MKRVARTLAGSGAAVAALGLGVNVLTWGDPTADKITMWVFIAGAVLVGLGILGGATEREGGERSWSAGGAASSCGGDWPAARRRHRAVAPGMFATWPEALALIGMWAVFSGIIVGVLTGVVWGVLYLLS
jgi:hypothetical protein